MDRLLCPQGAIYGRQSGLASGSLEGEPTSRRLDRRVHSDCASNLLTCLGDGVRCFVRKFIEIIDEVPDFDSNVRSK